MANKRQAASKKPTVEDLLRDLLIVNLSMAGLTQIQIREIVGGDIYRVNRIAKYINKKGSRDDEGR